MQNLRDTVALYKNEDNGLDKLLHDFEAACLRYLSVRTNHVYKKYTNHPLELIAEADQNRTRAHDNLIACYQALYRNLNKYLENKLPVLDNRKQIGVLGLTYGFSLLETL